MTEISSRAVGSMEATKLTVRTYTTEPPCTLEESSLSPEVPIQWVLVRVRVLRICTACSKPGMYSGMTK